MSGESILLVEDNDAVALGLKMGLEHAGYRVTRVATISDAHRQANENEPHFFILYIRLPDGSGIDLCRDLRSTGFRQPILILTARDDMDDKVFGLELGAYDYMTQTIRTARIDGAHPGAASAQLWFTGRGRQDTPRCRRAHS